MFLPPQKCFVFLCVRHAKGGACASASHRLEGSPELADPAEVLIRAFMEPGHAPLKNFLCEKFGFLFYSWNFFISRSMTELA